MPSTPSSDIRFSAADVQLFAENYSLAREIGLLQGTNVAPVFESAIPSGSFPKLPVEALAQDENVVRASDGSYPHTSGEFDSVPFNTHDYGLEERIDRRSAAVYRDWIDQYRVAAMRTRAPVMRAHTKRVFDLITGTLSATSITGTATARDTFDPVPEIDARKQAMRTATGVMPDSMLLEWDLYLELRDNAAIRDRFFKSNVPNPDAVMSNQLDTSLLRTVFDLENVYVSAVVQNTAAEGAAFSGSSLWPAGSVLLFVQGPTDGGLSAAAGPQFMRTIHWGEDGSMFGSVFEEYGSERRRSDFLRHRMETDEVLVESSLGDLTDSWLS